MATLSLCVTYSFRGAAPILFIALQDRASGQTMALLNVDSLAALLSKKEVELQEGIKQNKTMQLTGRPTPTCTLTSSSLP